MGRGFGCPLGMTASYIGTPSQVLAALLLIRLPSNAPVFRGVAHLFPMAFLLSVLSIFLMHFPVGTVFIYENLLSDHGLKSLFSLHVNDFFLKTKSSRGAQVLGHPPGKACPMPAALQQPLLEKLRPAGV